MAAAQELGVLISTRDAGRQVPMRTMLVAGGAEMDGAAPRNI
jgi:hypothetical protein